MNKIKKKNLNDVRICKIFVKNNKDQQIINISVTIYD